MGRHRDNDNVLGDFRGGRRNNCRRCFEQCEEALEFVEDVKDLLEDFFEEDKCHCRRRCHRNND